MTFDPNKGAGEYITETCSSVLKELEEKSRYTETPLDVAQKEKKQLMLKDAKELIGLNILNEEITERYQKLGEEIKAKKESIKKLYGIELSENTLPAIKEARKRLKETFEAELSKEEEEFREKLRVLSEEALKTEEKKENEANEKISQIEEEAKLLKERSDVDYDREASEYDYRLKRERKSAQDKRNEEILTRQTKLKEREREAIDNKERLLKRLDEIEGLREQVEEIPAKVEEARKEGAKEKEKLLGKAHTYQNELANKERELKIGALSAEYDRITKKYDTLTAELTDISKRLDQTNMESRKLTSDTVKFIGGINILNSEPSARPEGNIRK